MTLTAAELAKRTNARLGNGTVVTGAELDKAVIRHITTGSLAIDYALGGGWVANQWNEIIGSESNGKTAIVLNTVAANMKEDPNFECLWIASEDYVPEWGAKFGIDQNRIHVVATNVMEDAYGIAIEYLDERAVDMIVIDSLPALVPGDEAEKSMEEFTIGLGARLTGKFLRKATKAQKRSLVEEDRDCTGIIINQWRDQIGGWSPSGAARTTPGGKAKNYHYFIRMEVKKDEWITEGPKKIGISIKATAIKNKSAPPQRVANIDFYFADGNGFKATNFDLIKETGQIAIALEVVQRRGAYYIYGDTRWNGKAPFFEQLREDVDLQKAIRAAVLYGEEPKYIDKPPALVSKKAPAKKVARRR